MPSKGKTIFSVEEIELLDGQVVEVKPLPLKQLRKANKLIRRLTIVEVPEGTGEEDEIDLREEHFSSVIAEVVEVCVGKQLKFEDEEELDDVLDLDTAYRIIEVCTGIKLNDEENLVKAIQEANSQNNT